MANLAGFKATIRALLDNLSAITDPDQMDDARQQFTDGLCNAVDAFVKSGTVVSAVSVTSVSGVTAGPAVSGPGAGTASGTWS